MKSKIILFSLLTLLFWGILSCNDDLKNNRTVPYTPINVVIDIRYADFGDLKINNFPVYISVFSGKNVGYKGNGIIVMKIEEYKYVCYDATCPHCLEADTHIEITKGNPIAQCPTCQTYFLLSYGIAIDSEDEEVENIKIPQLQSYPINVAGNGNKLYIRE